MGRYPYLGTFERERKEDLAAIERAIQAAHIQGLRKRPINSLSSGERQLVVIARALAQEPRILLLDEPTSHLDLHHQSMIMNLLKKLNDQGIAIIIINHDLNLAGLYCERLILINRGRILAEGPPQALFNKDILKQAFGVDVELITHPQKDIPQILLK
jgi:iron complex transport system ATP-binding protein